VDTATVTAGPIGGHNSIASASAGSAEWTARAPDSSSPTTATPYYASTVTSGVLVNGRVVVGADIVLSLTWALAFSNANATTLHAGSYITASPVDGSI
jgi:hypothetical protein